MGYRKGVSSMKKIIDKYVINKKIMALAGVVIIILAISLFFIFRSSTSTYKTYNKEDKAVGSIKNYEDENDNFYVSIFYPDYGIKTLDSKIKEVFEKDIKEQQPDKDKNTLYMDYSSKECFDQYITTTMKFQRFDNKDKEIDKKNRVLTFDKKINKIITVKDIFRGKYKSLLQEKGIEDFDSTAISLDKENIIIYKNSETLDDKVVIPYSEVQDNLALNNTSINKKAPQEVLVPIDEPEVDPNKPMIAITFDDGPHHSNTQRVMDLFEKYNGRATFFMLGKLVNAYPDVVKEVYQRGFEIGNHSWSHANLPKKDQVTIEQEIFNTQNTIFQLIGKEPNKFRPPYGAINDLVKTEVFNSNVELAFWTGDTLDWKFRDGEAVKNAILNNAHDGAVILLHDIHTTSVDGAELALPILQQQGYQFVTLETLQKYKGK